MTRLEQIRAFVAKVAELTADELAELFALIEAETTEQAAIEPPTAESVTTLQELVAAQTAAVAEQDARLDAEAETAKARDEAVKAIQAAQPKESTPSEDDDGEGAPPEAEPQQEDTPDEGTPPAAEPQQDDDTPPAEASTEPAPERVPVAASGRPAAFKARGAAPGVPAPEVKPTALVASAEIAGFTAGQPITTKRQLGEAVIAKLSAMGRGGSEERYSVASATYPFASDESRILTDSESSNSGKIEKVLARRHADMDAMVAAGGLCAPLETMYDIGTLGSVARPVRSSLPGFAADRGGVVFRPNVVYTDLEAGITDWTAANDATPGSDGPATKAIVEIQCPTPVSVIVEATVLRIRFNNFTARFDPEVVGANTQVAQVAFARHAENKLLRKMDAQMKTLTQVKVLGATRDILALVDHNVAYLRDRHRLDQNVPLACILPLWAHELMRTDITRQMASSNLDALAVADAQIDAWFTRRNISITWTLDGSTADVTGSGGAPNIARQSYANAANNAAVPGYPNNLVVRLFTDGDFLYLNGGTLDLGLVRDSALNAVNKYETFYEEFDNVLFRGEEALKVVATVQPTGQSAGTADTSAIAD